MGEAALCLKLGGDRPSPFFWGPWFPFLLDGPNAILSSNPVFIEFELNMGINNYFAISTQALSIQALMTCQPGLGLVPGLVGMTGCHPLKALCL